MTVDAMGVAQRQPREWRGSGLDLRRRVDDGAVHIFREHNEEADAWAERGVRGRHEEWEDVSKVVWPDVTGLCGFWDGTCRDDVRGVDQDFHTDSGVYTSYEKCGPVPGKNSLDAEIDGCSVLIESLKTWVEKRVHAH